MELCAAILPEGVAVQAGEPPAAPEDYESGFVLPEHTIKPLQLVNHHPLDKDLEFFAEPHVYTFRGVPTSISVTALAHQFEKGFDAAAAIRGMKTGRRQAWPRKEYAVDVRPFHGRHLSDGEGALAVADGRTISVCHPHSVATSADVVEYLKAAVVKGAEWGEDVDLFTFKRSMEDEEIVKAWQRNGEVARNMGTDAHYLAELYFNGLPTRECGEMEVVFDFVRRHMLPRGLLVHNTEKEIVCVDADLAGSIDLILYDPANDVHHIVDHKRSDKLRSQMRGYEKMSAPFAHLDDCKGAGYALQTSIYQYVLERDYGMRIGDRILLSLHPSNPFETSVPYMEAEVSYIMKQRFDLVRARRRVAASPEFCCALTGAPAVDAVRVKGGESDGRLVMAKVALVRSLAYEPDWTARERFRAAVEKELPTRAPIDAAGCIPWKKRMPEAGIPPFQGW
jgi:hypothetical protein